MGYDWKGWAVIFYLFSGAFTAFGLSDATSWGLTAVQYKWVLMVLGLVAGVGAKMGASWAGKTNGGNTVNVANLGTKAIPFLLASSLVLTGCAAKVHPTMPPADQKMYDATEVAKRVNRLMDATIEAEAAKAIQTDAARIVIRWCVAADKTIAQYPAGYGPMLAQAWALLKADPQIKPLLMGNQYLATAATLIDVALSFWAPKLPEEMPCSLCYSF
jgi:hypothetical protein